MSKAHHQALLSNITLLYERVGALREFAPLPDDLTTQEVAPCHRKASDDLQHNTHLISQHHKPLQDALIKASPFMHWREVYRRDETSPKNISFDFMYKLGVYALIGTTGPFISDKMALFVVYMPAGLSYPWHAHAAEEFYYIISGEATFRREGHPDKIMQEGDTIYHHSDQPHAMQTYDKPLLSLAVWRNYLGGEAHLLEM